MPNEPQDAQKKARNVVEQFIAGDAGYRVRCLAMDMFGSLVVADLAAALLSTRLQDGERFRAVQEGFRSLIRNIIT